MDHIKLPSLKQFKDLYEINASTQHPCRVIAIGINGRRFTDAEVEEERKRVEEEAEAGLHIITSPIVGTYYRSPNPEAAAFVNVGDRVTKGKVLCIIEAMKLMNEIESDVDGVIVTIYPQNGQPVEYGEKLFAVKV